MHSSQFYGLLTSALHAIRCIFFVIYNIHGEGSGNSCTPESPAWDHWDAPWDHWDAPWDHWDAPWGLAWDAHWDPAFRQNYNNYCCLNCIFKNYYTPENKSPTPHKEKVTTLGARAQDDRNVDTFLSFRVWVGLCIFHALIMSQLALPVLLQFRNMMIPYYTIIVCFSLSL